MGLSGRKPIGRYFGYREEDNDNCEIPCTFIAMGTGTCFSLAELERFYNN